MLLQVNKLNSLKVLFTSEGKIERKINKAIDATLAVTVFCGEKREASLKAQLMIYQWIFVPDISHANDMWVEEKQQQQCVHAFKDG